jgi:hypothetical protein
MVSNSLWRAADHVAVTVKNAPDGGGRWSHSCQNILLALAKQTKLCHGVSHWAKSQGWSCEGANIGKTQCWFCEEANIHRSCEGACEHKCDIMIHYQSTTKYLAACWSRKGAQQALVPIQTSQKEDTVIHRHVRSVLQSCAAAAQNKSGYVYLAGKIQESQANCTCLSSRLHNPMFDANLPFIQTSMHQLLRRAGRGQNCWI